MLVSVEERTPAVEIKRQLPAVPLYNASFCSANHLASTLCAYRIEKNTNQECKEEREPVIGEGMLREGSCWADK
jgi:hypothetical protein